MKERPKSCIFCSKVKEKKDEENLIVHNGKRTIVVMNKFPYNNGHLLVIPKRHCVNLEELDKNELHELSHLLKTSIQVLKTSLGPHGFNVGLNLGKAGGAGEEHLHFHIVPRWIGDTNFMPVLGETKIIPEYLERAYQMLRPAFQDLFDRNAPRKHRLMGGGKSIQVERNRNEFRPDTVGPTPDHERRNMKRKEPAGKPRPVATELHKKKRRGGGKG